MEELIMANRDKRAERLNQVLEFVTF